jgi:hypothetical protein
MEQRYVDRSVSLDDFTLTIDRTALLRAAAKYGRAVAHTAHMHEHLVSVMRGRDFELEVSVDETDTPTSALEHFYVASELLRLGVQWTSLAPRYVGRFEKGVDFIGDLRQFEVEFAQHAAVARALGPYKLSLHSGSDKFSIYPIVARHAGELVHLKTAGTSFLEALRAIAAVEPELFRDVFSLARERYPTERASYHVSADLSRVPSVGDMTAEDLTGLLDLFDARQVLHVAFGSVSERYGSRIRAALQGCEDEHYGALEAHFNRHLAPFGQR